MPKNASTLGASLIGLGLHLKWLVRLTPTQIHKITARGVAPVWFDKDSTLSEAAPHAALPGFHVALPPSHSSFYIHCPASSRRLNKPIMFSRHRHQPSLNTLVGSTFLSVRVAGPSTYHPRDPPDQTPDDDGGSILNNFVGSSSGLVAIAGLPVSQTARCYTAIAGLPVSPTAGNPHKLETVSTFRRNKVAQEQRNPLAEGACLYTSRFSALPKLSPFDRTDPRWAESFGYWMFNIVVDGVEARLWTVLKDSNLGRVWNKLTRTLSDLLDTKEAELEAKRPPGELHYNPCLLGLYLIGQDERHAAPFVCVLPSTLWSGKAVCKILKDSGHLDYDNLQCGYVWGKLGAVTCTTDAPGDV